MSGTYPGLPSNQNYNPFHAQPYLANSVISAHSDVSPVHVPASWASNERVMCNYGGCTGGNNIPGNMMERNFGLDHRQSHYIEYLKRQQQQQQQQQQQRANNNTSNGNLLRRLQEREADVEHLRLRLQTETAPKYEAERLRKVLAETEYELEKTEKVLEEIINEKKNEMGTFSKQMQTKSKELETANKDVITLQEDNSALKIRIDKYDKYVSELPTSEDHKRLRRELKHWKKSSAKLQNQITEQQEKFNDKIKTLEEKAMNAEQFEKENAELKQTVTSLQDMMKKDQIHSKTMELEQVKFENERLQADLENMEKLLKENQIKTKAFYLRSNESQKLLVVRLSQEEDTVGALREEVAKKEIAISELKSSMKQLSAQYTDTVEEKMDLSDKVKQLQLINSKETIETNKKLYKQLRRCVNTLKDIMNAYCQRREGKDLDLSLLLGTGRLTGSDDHTRSSVTEERSLSDKVKELTEDIEELRVYLADQYAEELASDLDRNCVTQ